jgi:hypothetical protein
MTYEVFGIIHGCQQNQVQTAYCIRATSSFKYQYIARFVFAVFSRKIKSQIFINDSILNSLNKSVSFNNTSLLNVTLIFNYDTLHLWHFT